MPKFLDVTSKPAARAALGMPPKFYVDSYGADPTGVASSNSAVAAALAAMGDDPGSLVFGRGTYKLSNTINIGPYQSIYGDSPAATIIRYTGSGDAIRGQDTRSWAYAQPSPFIHDTSTGGPGQAGTISNLTIDGTSAGASGIHIGDMTFIRIMDVTVTNFTKAGAVGILMDNQVSWSERWRMRVLIENCTTGVQFQSDPDVAGSGSFAYGDFDAYMIQQANQVGVRLSTASNLYSMVGFRLLGGFFNLNSPSSNTGAVLHLDGEGFTQIVADSALILVEAGDSGGPAHKTIVREPNRGSLYLPNAFISFLGDWTDGSGPWSNGVISGYVSIDSLWGQMGAEQHIQRVIGGMTGSAGALENNGTWYFLGGNWFAKTLASGNTTITLADYPQPYPTGNQAATYNFFLKQPASGAAGTVTWPAGFVWAEGQAPTLSTTNNAVDWIHVETPNFVTFYATHVTGRNPRISKALGNLGNTVLNFVDNTGSQNYLNVYNGSVPIIEAAGADPNIGMYHAVKGTGRFYFNPGAGQTTCLFFTEGTAPNINWDFYPQGTGRMRQAGVNIPTVSSTDTLTNKSLTAPVITGGSGTATIRAGTGTPEGAVTATVGSLFMRTDGGAGTTLYVKETGTGNTGWVAK